MSNFITNAELRIEAERLCDENDDLRDELKGVQEKNAKLQELCIDMASHLREAERIHGDKLLPDDYITRMRDLGIEVTE